MNTDVMIIGSKYHKLSYATVMIGAGYRVNAIDTFRAARIVLRAGDPPPVIVIDLDDNPAEACEFIHMVRGLLGLTETTVVIIGNHPKEEDTVGMCGADAFFYRPANEHELIGFLRMTIAA